MVWLYCYVTKCNNGTYDPSPLYHYVTRDSSAYHKRFNTVKFDKSFYEEFKVYEIMEDYLRNDGSGAAKTFNIKTVSACIRLIKFMYLFNHNDAELHKKALKRIRQGFFNFIFYPHIPISLKFQSFLLAINPKIYMLAINLKGYK
jgi:hypothetical protein